MNLAFILMVVTINAYCSNGGVVDTIAPSGIYSVFTDSFVADPDDTTSVFLDWNHPALEQMRRRAETIGSIRWTPKREVSKRTGVFPQSVEVTGIPYSSVKELDKFVGQEVSFFTFLSAVNNPRSVLYTENVGLPPYHGKNCAAYYGSVCSMAVDYALGLDRPYTTCMYGTLPFIKRVAEQDIEHAAPGDIVYINSKHVFLITNIIKDNDDNILYVDILECAGNGAFNRRYTKQRFQKRLDNCEYVIYRYMDLQKLAIEPSPFPGLESYMSTSMTNNELSLSRGDRVTYSKDEGEVIMNVLDGGYDKLKVYKIVDGSMTMVEEQAYNGTPDIVLSGLEAGSYKAVLAKNEETVSHAVFFEILETNVDFSSHGNYIVIIFNSTNAIPEYVVFCKRNGSRRFIADITEEERMAGHKIIKCEASLETLYLKVFFKGEYGRVSNTMIPFKQ